MKKIVIITLLLICQLTVGSLSLCASHLSNSGYTEGNTYNGLIISLSIILLILLVMYFRAVRAKKRADGLFEKYRVLYENSVTIYNYIPVGLIMLDKEGNDLSINNEGERIRSLFINEHSADIDNIFDHDFISDPVKEYIRQTKQVSQILNYEGKEGEANQYFKMNVRYAKDKKRRDEEYIILMLIDISQIYSERMEKEKMNNLLGYAMEKSNLGIAEYNLLDGKGFATEGWFNNLMRDNKRPFVDIYEEFDAGDQAKISDYFKKVRRGEDVMFLDTIRVQHNNQEHWLRYVIKVVEYAPEVERIIIAELSWNVNAQKQREIELATALKKAKESEYLKNGFIANMSYEIKTPLNRIVELSEFVCKSESQELKTLYATELDKNTGVLLKRITEIIDLSKIESDTIEYKSIETNLHALFEEIAKSSRKKIEGKEIDIVTEFRGNKHFVFTDSDRLTQIIGNIVDYLLLFDRKDDIKMGYGITGNQLFIFISENGEVIDYEKQIYLLDRFSSQEKMFTGEALCLQISKSLVYKMHGTIGFRAEEDGLSTFWFKIPVKPVGKLVMEDDLRQEQTESESVSEIQLMQPIDEQILKTKKVLIAEDDPSNYRLISMILEDKCILFHAWNGEEAVELYTKHNPDIVLMDIKMPIMDGYRATEKIRELSDSVPIVAVTAYALANDEERILNSGFNAYLSKPYQRKKLFAILNQMFNPKNDK